MANEAISDLNRTTYELNKREMFDGMRAYHNSEIHHKKDAIGFLRSVLGVIVGVYGIIIGSFFSPDLTIEYAEYLVWIILLLFGLVISIVVNATIKKIEADHAIYANYGAEYTRFSYILGLQKNIILDDVEIQGKVIDLARPIGQGSGYKKTIHVIVETGIGIFLMALILTIITVFVHS